MSKRSRNTKRSYWAKRVKEALRRLVGNHPLIPPHKLKPLAVKIGHCGGKLIWYSWGITVERKRHEGEFQL